MVWWDFSSFSLSFLGGAWVSNKLSVFDRYSFIETLTSFSTLYKICYQFIWLKSCLRILGFFTGIFEKKSGQKINCGRWSEIVDVTLPDLVSSKEAEFEKYYQIMQMF